jgi:preprotein translocase subunit SecG
MLTFYLITVVHVLVCIILILVVLLQSGKGADLAGAFGGGATQTAFGSRGPASFLSKMTTVAAVLFMITSLSLALMAGKPTAKSIMETGGASKAAPASRAPAVQPAPAPTPEQIRQMQEEAEKKHAQQQPGSTPPGTPSSEAAPAGGAKTPTPAPKEKPPGQKP